MKTICGRCGLKLKDHTSAKCNEIIYLEREALLKVVKEAVAWSKSAKEALDWIEKHSAHEVVKNDPLLR